MAILFGKGRTTITEHIKYIFEECELSEKLVCRNIRHTSKPGAITEKTQESTHKVYNPNVSISIDYRVKSPQGTQFHICANQSIINGKIHQRITN